MAMTQCDRIIRHLSDGGSITSAQAMEEYGIYHLASRISDLKKAGVPIKKEIVHGRNRYGEKICFMRYSLDCAKEKAGIGRAHV